MPTRRCVGAIRAAAVPEAADPDEDAALGHFGGDGVVELERVRGLVAQVAARDEARRPVLLGEVGDRPHRVADDRDVRAGERDQLVVGVDRLRLLVGPDRDGGQGRDEEPRIEHAFHDGEDVGMHRDLLEGLAVDEEVVDAPRVEALEEVLGGDRPELSLELEKGSVDLVDELRLDGVGQHRVAVRRDALEVGLEVGERTRGRGRRLSWRNSGSRLVSRTQLYGQISGVSEAGTRVPHGVRIGPVVGFLPTGRWRSW